MSRITSASIMLTLAASFSVMADNSDITHALSAEPIKEKVSISKNGSRPWITGSEANFTGTVRVEPLFTQPQSPVRTTVGHVNFEPGARSAWHTHPLGQTLVITSGSGWTQEWGGERKTVHAGDIIHCPPGVKHWHGATATTGMSHLAIQEGTPEGKNVEWMEKVSAQQYNNES
ncbi:cupin domain-containing protein [Salmonella enterica]|uniref:Cupin domain-containing protein n=1 Tax=Salmonella enterica TaxID=28901 RepID=A0A8E6QL25_SALER|nr:cupin domain-containing protein [Salmonella enterica]EBP3896975.1 cupin domain-containing protein [Salmonella enterica subsp. enterica]EDS8587759.1 cupin domain-containing protein [Salmonella enterica subsp. enterica serovar Inverness]EDU6025845.1 cupin domain-containing protein [Salmonella enterica subsp. enterica serovar Brazil]EKB3222620.1 cupin domain-containing protein [Salmonella enterica subsp. enterica serovar Gaminara]EKV6447004.1 cupin domain-containing protein [Klebsiella oxytoca